jgi:phage terminase large subunit-like protein
MAQMVTGRRISVQTRSDAKEGYRQLFLAAQKTDQVREVTRELGKRDLFYLLVFILNRPDADNDWCFARAREIQADPYGYIDLWAREHYKSTLITFAKTIQDIINYPEWTTGIFSHTRPIAKGFLNQIKVECESNVKLPYLYPEVFWDNPKKQALTWSLDGGLIFKRKGNPNAASVEAWGLIDGQPTSKHYTKLLYNDIVTIKSVNTPDMIKKTTEAWETSLNLGMVGGVRQIEGTFYHYADTYRVIINKGSAIPRIYPATEDGKLEGKPVLWTREHLAGKIRDMGPYVSACQLFLDPVMDKAQGFKGEWLRYWNPANFKNMNIYILCDPAGEKKKENDYTCFVVIGLGIDKNYYLIEWIRDRLNLVERANVLFYLHQTYYPKLTGYEKFGKDSDIQHYEDRMKRDNYRFSLEPLHKRLPKNDRIKKLIAIFNAGRFFIPQQCVRQNYEGVMEDLTVIFRDTEYFAFPYCEHDDMLDCMADILHPDMHAIFPQGQLVDVFDNIRSDENEQYDPLHRVR